jgi:hypothetical protein
MPCSDVSILVDRVYDYALELILILYAENKNIYVMVSSLLFILNSRFLN